MKTKGISRRRFLRLAGLSALGAACAPLSASPTLAPSPTAPPSPSPVAADEAQLELFALAKGVWNVEAGSEPLVAVREPGLETVWVFQRKLDGEVLELRSQGGAVIDHRGRDWRQAGLDLESSDGRLPPAVFYDAMWFAWYAFYPQTAVVEA